MKNSFNRFQQLLIGAIRLITLTLLILTFTQLSFADHEIDLDDELNYPGGIALLKIEKHSEKIPLVRFGTSDIAVIDKGDSWLALIGLELELVPGEYVVYIKQDNHEIPARSVAFMVKQRSHQNSNFDDTNTPFTMLHNSFTSLDFSNTSAPRLPLAAPNSGTWGSNFGQALLLGKTETWQNYLSLSETNSPVVVAPQAAIVSKVLASENESDTQTIYLDHGRGVYSIISGVRDLTVKAGEGVVAGAVLGKIANHESSETREPLKKGNKDHEPALLYWQVVLNNVFVNPLILSHLRFDELDAR